MRTKGGCQTSTDRRHGDDDIDPGVDTATDANVSSTWKEESGVDLTIQTAYLQRNQNTRRSARTTLVAISTRWPVVAAVALVIGLWWGTARIFDISSLILPTPDVAYHALIDNFSLLVRNSWPTLQEALIGFGCGVGLGVPLGVIIARPSLLQRGVYPLVLAAQLFPMVAFAPLFTIWVGLGIESKAFFVMTIVFFPVAINTSAGFRSLPPEYEELASIQAMGRVQRFRRIDFPWALPSIFTGMRVTIAFALTGAIVGEFVGAKEGIGVIVNTAGSVFNTGLVFAALFCVMVLGFILFGAVVIIERICIPWHISKRRIVG